MYVSHLNCYEGLEGVYMHAPTGNIFTLTERKFELKSIGDKVVSCYTYNLLSKYKPDLGVIILKQQMKESVYIGEL